MFQSKPKIFAASVLGVSILLVGALVSFTIYIVAKSNAAYDGTSVGYIFGGSYDESYKVSQQLVKDKLVQHSLVVPTLLHNQEGSPGKVISVSTPSYLLLVQTSAELIPDVQAAIKKAYKGSNTLQVVFSPVAKKTQFLFFAPPTAPRSQAATKDAPDNAKEIGTAAATDHSSTTNSVRLSPDNADRQNGNFLRKLAAVTGRPLTPGERASWKGVMILTDNIAHPKTALIIAATEGVPFLIKLIGTRRTGYIWTLGDETSPQMQFEYFDKNEDGSMLDDALLYVKVTSGFGDKVIQLIYADPDGLEPRLAKIIEARVGTKCSAVVA